MTREIEILMSTGMTEYDAKRHLNDGAIIHDLNEYLDDFENETEYLTDDEKEELRNFLTEGKDGMLWDNDLTTYEGVQYYIVYSL